MPSVVSYSTQSKHNGSWKAWSNFWAKHAGSWKKPLSVHVRRNGSWVKVWDERPQVTNVTRYTTIIYDGMNYYTVAIVTADVSSNGFQTTLSVPDASGTLSFNPSNIVSANNTISVQVTQTIWGFYPGFTFVVTATNDSGTITY